METAALELQGLQVLLLISSSARFTDSFKLPSLLLETATDPSSALLIQQLSYPGNYQHPPHLLVYLSL